MSREIHRTEKTPCYLPKNRREDEGPLTLLLVSLLTVLWGAVFVPALFRARKHTSPFASVGSFQKGMNALGASQGVSSGRWIVMPPRPQDEVVTRRRAIERRRRIFMTLLLACALTLVASLFPAARFLIWVQVMLDVALLAFVVALIQIKRSAEPSQRLASVHGLPRRAKPQRHSTPEIVEEPLFSAGSL